MKNILKTLLVLGIISFGVNPLFAGAGHGHSHGPTKKQVSKEDIIKASKQYIQELIQADKIHANWKDSTLLKTEQKKFHANLEWVLSYQNMNIKDPKKQILYIFIDLYGNMKAANFTGK